MKFETMDDVRAHYARLRVLVRLRWQANNLCNALCHKLDWRHDPEDVARLNHALTRARARLARREAME